MVRGRRRGGGEVRVSLRRLLQGEVGGGGGGRVLMLVGRGSAAASGAVMQNRRLPVVLPPAYFRKPSGLGERTRGSTFGLAALGYELLASCATWRRGGGGSLGGVVSRPYRSLKIFGTNTQDFILG